MKVRSVALLSILLIWLGVATTQALAATPLMVTVPDPSQSLRLPTTPRRPNVAAEASVLMYHHIAAPPASLPPISAMYFVPPARFDQQIFYLLAHDYNFVSLEQIVAALTGGPALPPHAVAITIDDGWQDFWNNALPIVEKYMIPVTIFPIANADSHGYMNPAERWTIAHSGIAVGAHTLTHPHLPRLLPAVANSEIVNAKRSLEKELDLPVPVFAYPYGDYNPAILAMVKAAGYRAGFAATPYPNEDTADLFDLPRVLVSYYDTPDTFARKVADFRWARTHGAPMPTPVALPTTSPDAASSPSASPDPDMDRPAPAFADPVTAAPDPTDPGAAAALVPTS